MAPMNLDMLSALSLVYLFVAAGGTIAATAIIPF
jgi:hypothetical protein